MKRYEYKIESVNDMVGPLSPAPTLADILGALNELGAEG